MGRESNGRGPSTASWMFFLLEGLCIMVLMVVATAASGSTSDVVDLTSGFLVLGATICTLTGGALQWSADRRRSRLGQKPLVFRGFSGAATRAGLSLILAGMLLAPAGPPSSVLCALVGDFIVAGFLLVIGGVVIGSVSAQPRRQLRGGRGPGSANSTVE